MSHRIHPTLTVAAFAALVVTAAAPVRAQYLPYQPAPQFTGEVTVTATGVPTKVEEAPTSVTVITRKEIDDSQAETVADLLRRVPGLTVMRSGDEGKVTSVFTRGTNSTQTLVMLDGVRLNSPFFGGFDWSQLSSAGLRQVEVARGPYSALWGADAVGGVINLITRRGEKGWDGRILGEGGGDGWKRLEADIGWGGRTFDFYLSGSDRQADGELANSDFETRQLLLTAGWNWGRGSRLGILVQNLENETGIPFATPAALTPARRQVGEQTLIAIPFSLRASDSWTVEMTAATVDGTFNFSDPDDPFFTFSQTDTTSAQFRLASNHSLGGHTLSWGVEWRKDEVDDASNLGANLDGASSVVKSFFTQDAWQMSPKLRLLIGTRWDEADDWGSEVSPRMDLGWKVSTTLELRAGYGRAFRPPSLGELYFPFSGNPTLEPEISKSSELGLVYATKKGASRWQVTAFANDLENLIEFDFATYTNQNIANAEIRGAELGWERFLGQRRRTTSFVQFTYLDTKDDAGLPLLRRPEWSGSWTLHGAFSEYLSGDLTVIWVGDRDDIDPITFLRSEADGYVTANLVFAYSLWEGVEATMRVLNVADEAYDEVLGYPAPGRRYMFGIRLGRF